MPYRLTDGAELIVETADLAIIENLLRQEPRMLHASIEFDLPINIEGVVHRYEGRGEEVILGNNQRVITLKRDTWTNGGDLCVTCNPDGAEVEIDSINLHFRDSDDRLTDRGLVWVFPGEQATAMLKLHPASFGESNESIKDVIAAAERTVKDRVLSHFAS